LLKEILFVAARDFCLYETPQSFGRPIPDPFRLKAAAKRKQIIGAAADFSVGMSDVKGLFLRKHTTRIICRCAINDESDSLDRTTLYFHTDPARVVHGNEHLSVPDDLSLGFDLVPRKMKKRAIA
jgi:hypothetical protein